jgi:hypothetical protein
MIRVRIFVVFYNRLITIALPDQTMPVEQLIPALEKRLNLPWLEYVIKKEGKDESLPKKKTLKELGIKNDDILVFDFLRPAEHKDVVIPPANEIPNEIDYKPASRRRIPDWVIILILVVLVFLCFNFLILIRTWDIYR